MFNRLFLAGAASAALFSVATQPASALDRRVQIVNKTGFTMVNFYGSNTGAKSWEEDILGDDVLKSGQSVVVNFSDNSGYCKFDLRAVFDDGDEVVKNNVNICEIATFTFN